MAGSLLIMYWHGLGDLLCLTPQLRHLKKHDFEVDVLVRPQVINSRLMNKCPYIRKLIPLPFTGGGPAEGGVSGKRKSEACNNLFDQLSPEYDKSKKIVTIHRSLHRPGGKIFRNTIDLFTQKPSFLSISPPADLRLEVFIPKAAENKARKFIADNYLNGYIFKHTTPAYHPIHNWDPSPWISKNLPNLPVFAADSSPSEDINFAFVMAREATHRVLSSSVFVHACDAMGVVMDVVHYGRPNPHGLPLDANKIKVYHGNHGDRGSACIS